MCDKKFYYKLGENIRGLRRMWGETQMDLAHAVGVEATTISNYEIGERLPERTAERDVLIRIAKHYKITEDELLNGDFSNIVKIKQSKGMGFHEKNKFLDKCLPIICTEESLHDENFKKAVELHLRLKESIINFDSVDDSSVEKCIQLYKTAGKEGVLEAFPNLLWWNILEGFCWNMITPRLYDMIEYIDFKLVNDKTLLQSLLPSFDMDEVDNDVLQELEEEKQAFVDEKLIETLAYIRILKSSSKYSDLGDFYLALSYMSGLTLGNRTVEMNFSIGMEMLQAYSIVGNKYAKNIFEK